MTILAESDKTTHYLKGLGQALAQSALCPCWKWVQTRDQQRVVETPGSHMAAIRKYVFNKLNKLLYLKLLCIIKEQSH